MSGRIQRRLQWYKINKKKHVTSSSDAPLKMSKKSITFNQMSSTKEEKTSSAKMKPFPGKRKATNDDFSGACKKARKLDTEPEKLSSRLDIDQSEYGTIKITTKIDKSKSDEILPTAKRENKKNEKKRKGVKGDKKPSKHKKSTGTDNSPHDELADADTPKLDEITEAPSTKKYVLFVGNLPYNAGKQHVEKHFSKCNVAAVRLMTDETSGRSRGFGFIELKDVKGFKQALLLHHSQLFGREINVEFTSIGSGKSEIRKKRLAEKNKRCERFKILRPEAERYSKISDGRASERPPL